MKKGDRVKLQPKPDWGLGQVLNEPGGGKIEVYFINAGRKVMSANAPLTIISGREAHSAALDNLRASASISPFVSLTTLQKQFIALFPGGFLGSKYLREERDYKVEAHRLAQKLLSRSIFEERSATTTLSNLSDDVRKLVQKTNLIFPNEKIKFLDALRDPAHQVAFCRSLFELLFGVKDLKDRFTGFCHVLDEMEASKWTIATYFPFLVNPSSYMFFKPLVTIRAAEICNFELHYKSRPNWQTYEKLLAFAQYLFRELAELRPRDMIDVQSFIWCTGEQEV